VSRREISVADRPVLSHSADAVDTGRYVFVAGILPVNVAGELVGEDAIAQTRFVLGELGRILRAAGCGFEDVVKVTVFLTDVDDRPRINPLRQEAFGHSRPASTLVEVSSLAVPGARVEIDAIAAVPE
jgi:enamine deaminase RidA (YjgF/YER057c/UK114 family)